jgi:hypothetical protein
MGISDSGRAGPDVRARRQGRCYVCGYVGSFELLCRSRREGFLCPTCGSSLRYQHQAQVIVSLLGHQTTTDLATLAAGSSRFHALRIYEPGLVGPFRQHLGRLPGYQQSYFWSQVAVGQHHEGVRCEDLEHPTYAPDSFDLIITSDIFEHVRRPWHGFRALFGVLERGGVHVMSIPTEHPLSATSQPRVDTSGDGDRLLKPAVYHGSPNDPRGSLVYTDFGADLPDRLTAMGYEVSVHHGPEHVLTFVMRRPA